MTDRQKYRELYWCWKAIKQRCLNPKCRAYRNYGERGITICGEWLEFEPFLAWALKTGWQKGLEIDRIDNDGGYSPDNCRFTSRVENDNNRRTSVSLTVNGTTKTMAQWGRLTGIPRCTIGGWVRTRGKEYASGRIAEALEHGFIKCDYSRNHKRVPIIHVESGTRFESIYSASRHFGINGGQLHNAVTHGHNTRVGHFIKEVD